jgi:hypothetical protein
MEDLSSYSRIRELVALAKKACSITKANSEMTDDEIRTMSHWIFKCLPDTTWVDGKITPSRAGIDLMLFLTISEFPRFYQRYGLGQYN